MISISWTHMPWLKKIITRYDLQRDYIRIEVTETALVKEKHNLIQTLRQFQRSGYQVWLDDFGSVFVAQRPAQLPFR